MVFTSYIFVVNSYAFNTAKYILKNLFYLLHKKVCAIEHKD